MIESDKRIKRGTAPVRNPFCYQTTQDIVIPAGTILRHVDQEDCVEAEIGFGIGVGAAFVVEVSPEAAACGVFKPVTAS